MHTDHGAQCTSRITRVQDSGSRPHGRLHHLLHPGGGPLTAVQFVDDDDGRSVVLVWRPGTRFGSAEMPLRLRGLDTRARYRGEETDEEWFGAAPTAFGLPLPDLPQGEHASIVVRLRRYAPVRCGTRHGLVVRRGCGNKASGMFW
ncbi:hypothetical protein J3A78_006686 [Streptomyces sp. PvR006]|uniref:GH36 C-terminal domain-containing protein n=1 Tax=Streptomyces sp. PvR006 TaxID=2817860 RepID=UPI0035AC09FA|nr:hypothetical protein [Streptomyces sp. PvR006]